MDFSTVDVRYESDGATYQDLIDAAHEKGIKIVQDIVVNHSGNFGEATLAPMFTKEYDSIQDLASVDCMKVIEEATLLKHSRTTMTLSLSISMPQDLIS